MKETQSATLALEEPFSKSSRLGGVAEGVRHRCIAMEFQNHSQTSLPVGQKNLWGLFFSSLTQKALLSCNATATTADSMLIPVAAAGLSAASSSSS